MEIPCRKSLSILIAEKSVMRYFLNKDIKEYDNNNTEVTQNEKIRYDNSNTLVINDINIKNNLLELAKNYNKILRIIERYDKEYDKEYDSIVIELPVETIKDFRILRDINF